MTNGLLKKILMPAGIALGLFVGATSCNHNSAVQETTDIFRGYHNDIENGNQILIFDDELKENRDSPEDINLRVYGEHADTLKLNKTYVIGYIPSKIKSGPGKLEYIKEVDSAYLNTD
jgi:hypothetical protein